MPCLQPKGVTYPATVSGHGRFHSGGSVILLRRLEAALAAFSSPTSHTSNAAADPACFRNSNF